jgi:Na+/proline symporter
MIDPGLVENYLGKDSQLILPMLILERMPFVIQVIFFGALISVIMSTASGTLLAPSVTFSENILKSVVPHMSDRQFLWATKLTVASFACIVTFYAVYTNASIHTMVEHAYRITLAGAFVPLAAGLFWKRASNLGAALAITFGLGVWLLLEFTEAELLVDPHLLGLIASAGGMLIGSFLVPNQHHHDNLKMGH